MKKLLEKITALKPESYIFAVSFCVLAMLWLTNVSNKIIALILFSLIFVFYYKLRNIKTSGLLAYLVSSIVFTGKTYAHQIIPAGILPIEIYPLGFFINFSFTPSLVLVLFLLFLIVRDITNKRMGRIKINFIDILIVLFVMWPIFSDLIASKDPGFSLLFSIVDLSMLVVYFFIKLYGHQMTNIIKYFVWTISALILFESVVSIQQFLIKSPVFKNLEYMTSIEYFGNAADEIQFAFRPLGTFPHANALGVWLSSLMIIIFLILLIKPNRTLFVTCIAGFGALAMTLSRSAWLGFLTGILLCLLILEKVKKMKFGKLTRKYVTIFFLMIPFLGFAFILPRLEKSTYTLEGGGGYFRKVQLTRATETIAANPIFGIGTARSVQEGLSSIDQNDPDRSIVQNVHNWYVLGMIEHGLPYIILFAFILIVYFKKNLTKKEILTIPMNSINGIIQLGLLGGVLSSLIAGLFQPFINLQTIIFSLALFNISKRKNDF